MFGFLLDVFVCEFGCLANSVVVFFDYFVFVGLVYLLVWLYWMCCFSCAGWLFALAISVI